MAERRHLDATRAGSFKDGDRVSKFVILSVDGRANHAFFSLIQDQWQVEVTVYFSCSVPTYSAITFAFKRVSAQHIFLLRIFCENLAPNRHIPIPVNTYQAPAVNRRHDIVQWVNALPFLCKKSQIGHFYFR
jgi:hypothetical protein